jgi:hypothetical protein
VSATGAIEGGPNDWVERVKSARDGATIRLRPDLPYSPACLAGISHPAGNPVVVDAGRASFSRGMSIDRFKQIAADTARRAHLEGRYPGIYPIADQCTLRLTNCQGLTLRNFRFEDSWPTAVYLDNCTDIRIEGFTITGSTFAFYAVGKQTARLTLESCSWQQDPQPPTLWKHTLWKEIHEKYPDDEVHLYNGNRAFDGSFFLGREIAGDVEISHCAVIHAFNGVHFFNQDLDPALSRNVHVHDCTFSYIRDNALEPENVAYNWWFHDNTIFNCHKWLSFEVPAGGWYYIYRNQGWFDDLGGAPGEEHNKGGVFKFLENEQWPLRFPGPIEIFNNSWHLNCPIAKSGAITRLHHHNNAITFCSKVRKPGTPCKDPSVFGKPGEDHFTTQWDALDISFVNDYVWHDHWPDKLKARGYPGLAGIGGDPGFVDAGKGNFRLRAVAPVHEKGQATGVLLPDGTAWRPAKVFNVGWHQDDASVFADLRYQRLPDEKPGPLPKE